MGRFARQLGPNLPLTVELEHLRQHGEPEEVRKAAYDALCLPPLAPEQPANSEPPAGSSEQARQATAVPRAAKKLATFLGIAGDPPVVQFRYDGSTRRTSWPLRPDSEIVVNCCPGALEQFQVNDRVWVSRASKSRDLPAGLKMLADEITAQSYLNLVPVVHEVDLDRQRLVVDTPAGIRRTLEVADGWKLEPAVMMWRLVQPDGSYCLIRPGDRLYLQTAANEIRRLLTPDQLHQAERAHRAELERRFGPKPNLAQYPEWVRTQA